MSGRAVQVFMLSADAVVDEAVLLAILESGHSRVPVHKPGSRCAKYPVATERPPVAWGRKHLLHYPADLTCVLAASVCSLKHAFLRFNSHKYSNMQ